MATNDYSFVVLKGNSEDEDLPIWLDDDGTIDVPLNI